MSSWKNQTSRRRFFYVTTLADLLRQRGTGFASRSSSVSSKPEHCLIWLLLSLNSLLKNDRYFKNTQKFSTWENTIIPWSDRAGRWTKPRPSVVRCTVSNVVYTVLSLTHINLITEWRWAPRVRLRPNQAGCALKNLISDQKKKNWI